MIKKTENRCTHRQIYELYLKKVIEVRYVSYLKKYNDGTIPDLFEPSISILSP